MKQNIKLKTIAFISLIAITFSCEKNAIPEVTEPLDDSATFMKFFFHVEEAPDANFYLGNEKITAENSSNSDEEQGSDYGSVSPSNAYSIVPAGQQEIRAVDIESNELASVNLSLNEETNYSTYLVGTTSNYEIAVIEDNLPENDNVKIYWRFVNTMANMPFNVDAYAVKDAVEESEDEPAQTTQIISLGSNVGFKEAGEYMELDPGSYSFKVFATGTDYDVETTEPYLEHSLTLASLGRIYSTQIRGTYSEESDSGNIDYWRDR